MLSESFLSFNIRLYPLSELGDEAEDMISAALVGYPGHEVLSEGFRLQITRNDMDTLSGLNWLNDEVHKGGSPISMAQLC